MLINNQYPGPVITANWGDTLVINVKNSLQDNGTSIHWHGPIAPGKTKTYKFLCTQFGTTWYHSHHSAQYGDGVVGTMVINGPATANYDIDLGPVALTDWYYKTAFELNALAMQSARGPPLPDNILVNGKMVNAGEGGEYMKMTVTKGKKYRLRLINTSTDTHFHVSLDGHPFTVITSDFVPVKPYVTSDVQLNIGQRHDVIFTANQAVANYWLRVGVSTGCGNNAMIGVKPIGGIISYTGAPAGLPTSTGVTLGTGCGDESVTPYVANVVPKDPFVATLKQISLDFLRSEATGNLVTWPINGSAMRVDWDKPTLQYVMDGNTDYPRAHNVIEMPNNQWYYWVIQTVTVAGPRLAHPIHLHGHDFYVLGAGGGTFSGSADGLNFANPIRRDVATLPAGGWLVLAFPADNPGAWLMHCHIAWHVSQGLSLQFLERKSEIRGTIGDLSGFTQGCNEWKSYWASDRYWEQDDSGL
ncbi:laccase, multicopper oxidase, benzenediol:oxygen oxidorectuctase [Coniosporium tulheliwenetii]|uniref:Laccase, multicopper oxidase, benzenediol:oxygen oxidorectuctase n=1 Tax=Coniosporium tulheliwenetii TaxID=3383036 RepID=A0ACC2ZKQ6_9PEZI|nr:laccase, multicopper oxidase, benzenediol:oxygen oxidorectuctase [Cladosporium sp. JES 115]